MAKLNILILSLCCLVGVCVGQIVLDGQCDPNIQLVENFDINQFNGIWYEVQRSESPEQNGQCAHFDITLNSGAINVYHSGVNRNWQEESRGTATLDSGTARLLLNIPMFNGPKDFWVLMTNYQDFAVTYSCENISPIQKNVNLWVLLRTRGFTNEMVPALINTQLNQLFGFGLERLSVIDHSDTACYILPDIAPGQPVIIPGQCDNTIPVVQNFNVQAFTGTWHQVASYYSESATGTCPRAEYTLENGVVNVLNSEVVNQALRTISGTAVVSSNDGSARLRVTLNVNNQNIESDLWILGTDYNNYAISYSCENVGTTQQRIFSWVLSKTPQLSSASLIEVHRVIDSILVLNDEYYTSTDHSPTGCFFYPEVTGRPVIFRGQCDQSLPAMQNFNIQNYMGLWHTIEQYPSANQEGSCSNAFYVLNNGVVDVLNSDVIGERLNTATATAVPASNDGSGKLRVTFPIPGSEATITTDYWVMGTDYSTYALVYSCTNEGNDNMRVASWKLSRAKTLSSAADTAINALMTNVNVLRQMYFQTMDQSVEGCFFFPIPDGRPVVFPGACNPNIAMQNFVLSQFQGTWYETESYPKEQQTGHCIDHTFSTTTTNNQLNLVSSSVTDQFLGIVNGVLTGTDNSGRLTITVPGQNGQPIQIPFWIIATDYSDYALAYACENTVVNDNNDFKAVWSWKLSRTRQQSQAGTLAINNAMANIVDLDQQYYGNIDQSPDACFYLPEIAPGQPIILPGLCDESIRGIDNFNLNRFNGRWRLVESYATDDQTGTCNVARYSVRDATTLDIEHSEVVGQSLRTITGSATQSSTEGRLRFTFSNGQVMEYIILDTDYDDYAFAYSCENVGPESRRVWSWKLSRTDTLSVTANNNINQIINSIQVLNNNYYYAIGRTEANCFFFPEVDNNIDVKFRGQCNENFPVVEAFDVPIYMGLWHDISSYPMRFQSGSCPNAFYALIDGIVNVRNTQVLDQSLDTMLGTAELAATDGSAKLTVTFNVFGQYVTSNYWVLATDYTDYALVYSCENVDDEFMNVYSWKLSKSKTLSAAANTAMNNIINAHNILDQRYYINRDQSPAGCFHFPEPEPKSPVVFPGQCDTNIAAVPNFNTGQFAGLWHETSSYHYAEFDGQCVNHQFAVDTSAASTIFNLESFNILNETLYSASSPVNPDSTDGTGKFTITTIVDGQPQTIPFWILATDYEDYALAYGCVNLNTDYRRIYSWKLSRRRVPSAAGTAAINNAMAPIDVLENVYFENVQQTDQDCFYLPDISNNEPVTFPGQCDQNIPVVQNFDAARYLGRWRLIETYYSEFQSGTCSEANYSLNSDSTVEVFNTQVVNEQLLSSTGTATAAVDGSGKLTVTFPESPTPSELWILATDYESYALAYTCENLNDNRRRVWSWKMSRTNTLSPVGNVAINEVVNNINVLNDRYYQAVERTDAACFYYPTPDQNNPVIFRGQCDLNIPALPNFDPERYRGQWYDIQSYPANFQTGTCPTATYTLNDDGTVHLVNTQVNNQLLEAWTGTAVLVSDDGSAKLDVTINVGGIDVTSKLWVLDTDYESYALAYSCTNLDDERRMVSSWKMSRTPTLTPQANTAINNVMSNVQVLRQQYFVQRSHTEEACFYYPDNNGGDVILYGQCIASEAVAAITPFDVNLFAGTWYEISRFPSGLQTGGCVANQYVASGANAYTISQTYVNNDRQNIVNTQATVDNDGRGVITINVEGVPISSFYILDTDYTEYALTYGCRNVNETHKQIYSWKLSKSQSGLSAAANDIIDAIVTENIDLWEGYYEVTGQDSDACFYYPVFESLPSNIRMPVPCLPTIRGMANFNRANYLGTWLEVARYPTTDQKGQCNRGRYYENTLGQPGWIFVSFTEVIEQALQTQLATADDIPNTSGEFRVELYIDGEVRTYNYYVIATDYTSYSLVYSCTNLNDGTSIVNAWKRSRTTSLSPAAAAEIDNAISNTRGIAEEYFQPTSQSDDDCFYLPVFNPQQAPRFRGQCQDVTAIEGFDVNRYLGWWHEIERYPIDGTPGECRSTEYTQVDPSTYRVVDASVLNNNVRIEAGTVTITNDGRITKTLPGRADEEIWVLATDYETYALLYSCENVGEYKRVWSALHSKTRDPISEEAKTAIAPLIANNRVLIEDFYLPVDQSDETCFHYPSIESGDVIIPGQCDTAITVVSNFDTEGFAGDWYHIERYDDIGISSCVGSRYTNDEASGTIVALNYEVRNEELETVEGTARVVSNDGSARIELNFPVADTEDETRTTPVMVLATDYTNYALVYNCVNVNAFERQVRAWKLSRGRTMSTVSNTAINAIIAQRPELHQQYFKQIEQNEECPEPSSALIVKSSIIMLLVCALLQRLL